MSKQPDQRGFTIIELMIATTVMSFLLLIVTATVISIGNLYYKGITQSRVQDNSRRVVDEISQRLQTSDAVPLLSPKSTNGLTQSYCIGSVRYSFSLSVQVAETPAQHVLWRDTVAAGTCPKPADNFLTTTTPSTPGPLSNITFTELMTPRARLTGFCISSNPPATACQPVSSPYTVSVDIAIGEDDQLCNSQIAGNCDLSSTSSLAQLQATPRKIQCKGSAATSREFCATSSLTTTIVQRVR